MTAMGPSDQVLRQWNILRFIEANPRITLDRLAREQEYPRHRRTLRRDLVDLSEAGFPIYDERVDGKTYWRLLDTYRSFSLPLSSSEVFALCFGVELLGPLRGTFLSDSIQSLLIKAKSVLDPKKRGSLTELRRAVTVGKIPHKTYERHKDTIQSLRSAIVDMRTVLMSYLPLRTTRPVRRRVNPYGLHFQDGTLYLVGFDHLRKKELIFAVDRIQSLEVMGNSFQPPLYFSIEDYFKDSFGIFRGKVEDVEIVFEKPTARWVQEKKWHHSQTFRRLKGGRVSMKLQVETTPDLQRWVMGFGSQVLVLKPSRLAQAVRSEAWRVLGRYEPGKSPRREVGKKRGVRAISSRSRARGRIRRHLGGARQSRSR